MYESFLKGGGDHFGVPMIRIIWGLALGYLNLRNYHIMIYYNENMYHQEVDGFYHQESATIAASILGLCVGDSGLVYGPRAWDFESAAQALEVERKES